MLQPKTNSEALTVLQLLCEGARPTPLCACLADNLDVSSHAQGIGDASAEASVVGQKEGMNKERWGKGPWHGIAVPSQLWHMSAQHLGRNL